MKFGTSFRRFSLPGCALFALAVAIGASEAPRAVSAATEVARGKVHRLTAPQYTTIIADLFGASINIGGRFEPDPRVDGLIAVGSGRVSVTPTGLEQYDSMARSIASQVLAPENRRAVMPCTPASESAADNVCAEKFLAKAGGVLFRRPLTKVELQAQVAAAAEATEKSKNFYTGLGLSLASMLTAPEFLFRVEEVEPEARGSAVYRLTASSKAQRLSFFLWNTVPDAELLRAAEKGELNSARGLARQVDRMLASSRLEEGLRAFFDDMLHLEGMGNVVKDTTIYPKFDAQIAAEAREQTLRTIMSVVLAPSGDYRDIFTTRKTHMTPRLASVYKVLMENNVPIGAPDDWQAYTFADNDPRAGVLMQTAFVSMNSHPGRSSPTLRGKALREVFLCQRVPAPPGDVDIAILQDTGNSVYRTARDRLNAHTTNPVCAGCHKITDPMGLALENFDGGGGYRTVENGVQLDTSGQLDNAKFTTGAGLGEAVRNNPAATSCLVQRITAYGLGYTTPRTHAAWVDGLKKLFAETGYNVPALMRQIATSPEFYRAGVAEQTTASASH